MSLFQRIARRLPWMTLALAGLTVVLYATLGPAASSLVFDRTAIAEGEWWRLLSGHWIHSDASHLAWNSGALLVLGAVLEMKERRALFPALLVGSLTVDLLVWFTLPGMTHYCGLSGILNALLPPVLYTLWRRSGSTLPVLIGLCSLGKILVETVAGQALLTQTAWASVPLAHLAGWLAGLALVATTIRAARSPGVLA